MNPIDAVTHADPYAYYRGLRENSPLYFDDALGVWVVSRFSAVHAALLEPALRVRPPGEPVPSALSGTAAGAVFAQLVRMNDGDFHAAHRPPVERTARQLAPERVAEECRAALNERSPEGGPDRFLSELPVRVMARLLGVPASEHEATIRWVCDFTQAIAPGASSEAIARAEVAVRGLMEQGASAGLDPVRSANRIAMMQQSMEATAGLLGNTICLLLERPELEAHLSSPEASYLLAAEVARWDAPVQNTRRFAEQETMLEGKSIAAGEGLLLLLASANRDDAANPRAEEFEVDRPRRLSLTFGAGNHACPGEVIAIQIVATGVAALRKQGPLARWFGPTGAYRSLPNVRIPVFEGD